VWRIVLRTIKGNEPRCLLSAGGVATAILVFLLLSASFAGVVEKSLELYRSGQVWDIVVLDHTLTGEEIAEVRSLEGIRMQPGIGMDAGIRGDKLQIVGLEGKGSVFKFEKVEGNFPEGDQIMLPEILAELWGTVIGDRIQVSFLVDNEIRFESFEVSAIFSDGTEPIVISLEKAREIISCEYNAVFIVLLEADPDFIYEHVEQIVAPEQIISYKDTVERIQEQYGLTKFSMNLASFLVFLVAGIGMFAMMMISVTARRREIGILKALGVKSGEVFSLFFLESVIVTSIGVAIGTGAALGSIFLLNLTGGLFILRSSMIIKGIVMCFVVTFLFSLYPLLVARRASVMDCMRLRGDIIR